MILAKKLPKQFVEQSIDLMSYLLAYSIHFEIPITLAD